MKAYPFFEKRKTHDLNRIWDFRFLADTDFENIEPASICYNDRLPVPSAFDAFPSYAGKRGIGAYRCFVEVSKDTEAILKIGGAGMISKTYVDGVLMGSSIGTYTPFDVKVPASRNRMREIVVITDNRYDFDRCPLHENFFDFYNYGGIIRQVWLEELPANPILRAYVITEDACKGTITVKVEFYGDPVSVAYSIDGEEYRKAETNVMDDRTVEFSAIVPDPSLWSADNPNLHLITVDSASDSITIRFGLRQIKTEKGSILLNGEPLKLLGYCRHEAHPQFGPATPEPIMISDLQLLKDMGCNFIRGSHYQQDPRFLDLCDEMGFLVFSESTGWGADRKQLTSRNFIDAQMEQTKSMILTDFNHPSIIMWGFLNEGASDAEFARECYIGLIDLIRSLDPSRPVTYASNRYMKDLFLEKADIISFNLYPGWYSSNRESECPLGEVLPRIREMLDGLEKRGIADKPFIISEIGAGAIYGWHDPLNGYWTEEYQAELLSIVCKETVSNPKIAGLSLWQFCDIRTYQGGQALGRPRAFNNKGTFDEYRRPKAARLVVKSIFESAQTKSKG